MNANRILIVLVAVTVAMQATILYRQNSTSASRSRTQEPVRNAPKETRLDLTGSPLRGNEKARVVFVEFSDYECPYCAKYATGVASDINKEFIATGKIRLAFVNNPLPIHPNARMLATAAICAGEQDRYWEMHDGLFASKPNSKEAVINLAVTLHLNVNTFDNCLDQMATSMPKINSDAQKANALGLTVTPAFAIGHVDSQGQLTIDKFVTGAVPLAVFEKAITEVIGKQPESLMNLDCLKRKQITLVSKQKRVE